MWYLHDHVAKHLDKAAVAVQDETLVTGLLNHASHCIRVEAKVEDGVHHAGHRAGCTTANRDEERVLLASELCIHHLFKLGEVVHHLLAKAFGILPVVRAIKCTRFGADRKARRHRKTDVGHVGEVCTLTAEQLTHLNCSFRVAGAKEIDILGFLLCHT